MGSIAIVERGSDEEEISTLRAHLEMDRIRYDREIYRCETDKKEE